MNLFYAFFCTRCKKTFGLALDSDVYASRQVKCPRCQNHLPNAIIGPFAGFNTSEQPLSTHPEEVAHL
jgi:DNA-directed RNA polymerase subunit RPC12/RpoP